MKIVKKKSWIDNLPVLEDGNYIAEFVDIEERRVRGRSTYIWRFRIDDKEVQGITSTTVNEQSKAYRWLKILNGGDFNEIDTESLKGRIVQVIIQNITRSIRDREVKIPRVIDILPAPKQAKEYVKEQAKEQEQGKQVKSIQRSQPRS